MRHVRKLALAAAVTAAVAGMAGAVTAPASSMTTHLTDTVAHPGNLPRMRPVISCDQLANEGYGYRFTNVPGAAAYIMSAAQTGSGDAAVCHVTGYIAPQEQFQLALPVSSYTGRYLQAGCGGLCGWGLMAPAGPLADCPDATAIVSASAGQFAGGTDNQGHVGAENDALWAREDPALRVSFGYTSEHALAQLAKAVITAYYGKPPVYSFYDGCSDGGHEALTEAQRYPHDFNGILAGAPGFIMNEALSVLPAWLIAVNSGRRGHEILGSEKLPALHAAVIKACGNRSGLIEDPRSCGFSPASIQCPPRVDKPTCLTLAQVTVVRDIYLGPSDGHGHYLYPGGEAYGSELAWAPVAIDPSTDRHWPYDTKAYQAGLSWLRYGAYWHNPPSSFKLRDFRFTVASYRSLLPLAGIYDATDPDLSAFRRAGGKLILWQGWADQNLPPFATVDYYKAVVRYAGGFPASQAFTRLYLIPAQYHCLDGGSPQVNSLKTVNDLLAALLRWAGTGAAPGSFAFPLAQPTGALRAIRVHPLNPLSPPPGGARGLNTRYRWIGRFRPGSELWCSTTGMDLTCGHRRPSSPSSD